MRQGEESIARRLGKALQIRLESDTHEPLPHRWVELILYLNEQERERSDRQEPKTAPHRG